MSPRFVLGRENVPCVAEVVNRSLKADCTDFTTIFAENERHSRKRNISHFKKVVRRNIEQSESESDVELQAPENDNLQAQGNHKVQ